MEQIVQLLGFPRDIVSDRGSIFVSRFWSSFLKNYGVGQSLSSAYHPQTDGQTERVNQELEQYLRIYSDQQQQNWIKNLSMAELLQLAFSLKYTYVTILCQLRL